MGKVAEGNWQELKGQPRKWPFVCWLLAHLDKAGFVQSRLWALRNVVVVAFVEDGFLAKVQTNL